MKAYITKTTISQRRISIKGQKGISLIPALITICIFTLLTTQVIVPNQIRNANEKYIDNLVNSAKILEQASLAYYSAKGSWPATITGDLVPLYLPVFDRLTDVGSYWVIADLTTDLVTGDYFINNKSMASWRPSQYKHSKAIVIQAGNPQIAKALIHRIGGHARLGGKNPISGQYYTDKSKNDIVHFPLVAPGTTTVDNLNIIGNFELGSTGTRSTFKLNGIDITAGLNALSASGSGSSSKRFKQNIHPLETPIENIYQLKPVSFDYKEAYKQYKTPNAANSEIGLIAEQVLPLIPEITLLDDDNKVMGIDYPKLSILLLSAIQALKGEVTALQKNNQQLQQQMDALNIESEGLNIEGLNSANINNARIDNGTDE